MKMFLPSFFVRSFKVLLTATVLSPSFSQAALPSPMLGQQSNNTGIRAVPAPGPVKIDGDLSDWDFSGRIWSFADMAIRDRYSAQTAAMWDQDYLYLAVKFTDPTPLHNTINPVFDPESGWRGDSLQLRLLTDWPQWLTMWHFGEERRSMLHQAVWRDAKSSRNKQDITLRAGEPGAVELGDGVAMAFKVDADGRGYVQEVRLPWKILYKNAVPAIESGLTFRMGLEFFYGAAGESIWPVHRYADNLQEGQTSREFFWTAKDSWGDVRLVAENNVEQLVYVPDGGKIEGSIALRATIPTEAKQFTLVIETPDGKRVRNLGAQLNPEQYSQSIKDGLRTVEVLWDGLDDDGVVAAPGNYQVRGLSHKGIGATYVMSFFNPGTPPWEAGRSGSWGADHGAPRYMAAAGEWAVIGWAFAEGGHGIIGIGPDGLKKWGEKRGVRALAADENSVYFVSSSWYLSGNLCRLNLIDGTYKPFILEGKERPFELTLAEIFGSEEAVPGEIVAIASSGKTLALAMSGGKVALLDSDSAALRQVIDLPDPTAVAYGPAGELYALSSGRLVEVNLDNGTLRNIATPRLVDGGVIFKEKVELPPSAASEDRPVQTNPLTVDTAGNIGLFDNGPDQQIKFYTPSGKFKYAVGRKGGRPIRGKFNPQAMRHVSAIAVDSKGQVWATENWEFPRRVSVWARNGKLVRDYVGNTGYAGTGAFLHDQDQTLAYYGPVELKLDLKQRTWAVQRVLWVPDASQGEQFPVPTTSHTHPHRFRSAASGKSHEYMFSPPYRRSQPYVVYMEGAKGAWRPVSAIGILGQISGELEEKNGKVVRQPDGEYAGYNAYDGYFWNDHNGDGKVQFSEVKIIPAVKPAKIGKNGEAGIPLGSGWGTRMSKDNLSFFVNGLGHYAPTHFAKDGAPVFGPDGLTKLPALGGGGDYVPVASEDSVIALTWEKYFGTKGLYAIDAKTGEPRWSYPNPFPGVHGSHRAPMPQPGLVIGPLKILGVADLPQGNGHVFGLRGNLGQDYYFTTDGLFIGTIFQDGRLPDEALPANESELFDAAMESYGGGGEPFTGWFGGHDDGKLRLISGMPRQAAMILEATGFDTIKRFDAPGISVNAKQLTEAAVANDVRAALKSKAAEKRTTIAKLSAAPAIDGKGTGWGEVPTFQVKSSSSNFTAKARLGYDATTLYLSIEVEDPSPWQNLGVDFTRLFKTGDAVDIQFGTGAKVGGDNPVQGDLRVVLSQLNGDPVAVLMQPINPQAPKSASKLYSSPVSDQRFDEVRLLPDVKIAVRKAGKGYHLEAALPLMELGLTPKAGTDIRGDVGFISSDATGTINIARTYWSNQNTNLVNDEPFEALFKPAAWGTFTWGE